MARKPKDAKDAAPVKQGRPSDFTLDLAEEICEALASTPRGLDWICARNEGFPSARTVNRWLAVHEEFRQNYAHARERQADLLFDECLEIADDTSSDTKMVGREGAETEACDSEWISRSKLRVDTRKWMAGKLAPKKYGDKVDVNHTGAVDFRQWMLEGDQGDKA